MKCSSFDNFKVPLQRLMQYGDWVVFRAAETFDQRMNLILICLRYLSSQVIDQAAFKSSLVALSPQDFVCHRFHEVFLPVKELILEILRTESA